MMTNMATPPPVPLLPTSHPVLADVTAVGGGGASFRPRRMPPRISSSSSSATTGPHHLLNNGALFSASHFHQRYFLVASLGFASLLVLLSTTILLDRSSLGFDSSENSMQQQLVHGVNSPALRNNHNMMQTTTIRTSQEDFQRLREQYPPSVWTLAGSNRNAEIVAVVRQTFFNNETKIQQALELCGKFLYSSLQRAVSVSHLGQETYVATGDIDHMWTRDSAVQMGLYLGRMAKQQPWLRLVVEGAIRRQAFNTIQDPYANAYNRAWIDPASLELKYQAIGRGGWVGTRNYELDSGAYFFTQLWDYYVTKDLYRPESLLDDALIFDAVNVMVDVWIVEQRHDELSPYRKI
jgi:Metal-independent alpha-mannosidase (GH125)